jgi:cell division protein FtsL
MLKLLHVVAIGALISSAVYAYSIKYESTFAAEEVQRLKKRVHRERDAIAVLKAEWQHLNRPERLQALAERHLPDMQPLTVTQITRWQDIPMKGPRQDSIGRKLDDLGLSGMFTSSIPSADMTPAPGAKPALGPKPQVSARPAVTRPTAIRPLDIRPQASTRTPVSGGRP